MPLLATSCMFAADNLRSFAPIFGINSMQRKEKNIVDSRRKNETRKTQAEGKVSSITSPCCQERKAMEEKVENMAAWQAATEHSLQIREVKTRTRREKERRKKQRRRGKERQRRRRRHEKKRRRLNNKEKVQRKRLNNEKEKGKRLNNNNNNNKKKKGMTRKIPLCLVRCLTANLMHPAHCHVLCS